MSPTLDLLCKEDSLLDEAKLSPNRDLPCTINLMLGETAVQEATCTFQENKYFICVILSLTTNNKLCDECKAFFCPIFIT